MEGGSPGRLIKAVVRGLRNGVHGTQGVSMVAISQAHDMQGGAALPDDARPVMHKLAHPHLQCNFDRS